MSRKADSASHMKICIGPGELDEQLRDSVEGSRELDELVEQLGELDEDGHETRRVEEQLGESDEF